MEQENEQTEPQQVGNSRPVARFNGSGGLQVSIWKDKTEGGWDRYTIKADRTYKDDNSDSFKTTSYMRDSDLLRLRQLLLDADAWIEQDKGKMRGSVAQSANAR